MASEGSLWTLPGPLQGALRHRAAGQARRLDAGTGHAPSTPQAPPPLSPQHEVPPGAPGSVFAPYAVGVVASSQGVRPRQQR